MKTHKFLIAAAAALALAHSASAVTNIYISGAPAARAIWNQAILDTLNANGTGSPTLTQYYSGSSFVNSNQIAVTGGNIGGTAVNIYGAWDGSTSGNQSVAANPANTTTAFKVAFINTSTASPNNGTSGAANLTDVEYPTINLSDTKQNTLPFNGTSTLTSPNTSYVALTEATPNNPAVTGYEFVVNNGAPSSITNLNTLVARQLFTSDYGVPLAFFSGNSADQQTIVYPIGRDIGSGSRYIFDAESGIGTANNASVVQFTPAVSGGVISDIVDNPSASGTINLIAFQTGNGGYPSTSAEEVPLKATSSNSVGYVIGYLSDGDAAQTVSAGARALTWNGVAYSAAAIEQGSYTFWSYLHVFYNPNNIASIGVTFANDLSSDISTDTNTGAILSSALKVTRSNDGDLISPTYSIP